MSTDICQYAYAASVAAGGIFGYIKAQSLPSLGAGLIFGSILGYGAYQTSQDPTNVKVTAIATLILGGLMGFRYHKTGKLMPAGILAIVSTLMLIRTGVRYYTAERIPLRTE